MAHRLQSGRDRSFSLSDRAVRHDLCILRARCRRQKEKGRDNKCKYVGEKCNAASEE